MLYINYIQELLKLQEVLVKNVSNRVNPEFCVNSLRNLQDDI